MTPWRVNTVARTRVLLSVVLLLVTVPLSPATAVPAISIAAATAPLPRHSTVVGAMMRAADYYRVTYAHTSLLPKNGWSWSTYAQGLQALYRESGDLRYLDDGLAWGASNGWQVTTAELDPNSIEAGKTYLDLHRIDPTAALTNMDATMAKDLTDLPLSRYDWIDALFMGLPDWAMWASRTGNPAYLTKMDQLYLWTRDQGGTSARCAGKPAPGPALFDATRGLWYRDCRFIGAKDANGLPIFWARGNGWVIAAMAEMLQSLPAGDLHRDKYAAMLRTMAASLRAMQGQDGFWRANLTDTAAYPSPETSGTALITYAIAYGIRTGTLDSATYLPVVQRAWQALTTVAEQPGGFVTDCQPQGTAPASSYTAKAPRIPATTSSSGSVNDDSPPFCVGAFLLAGSQVAKLTAALSTGCPVGYTAQQTGNEARRVDDGDVTTRWSASGFPEAVTVDLGANRILSNAMVVPYLNRAYRYRIETSTDKVHWQSVVDRTSNTSTGTRLDDFATGPVSARYVRLTVIGVSGTATNWVSIQEFAVYDR